MEIRFISDLVYGSTLLEDLKLVCVKKQKYAEVKICIKGSMNIPIADIKLYDTDRYAHAEACFKQASALGDAIVDAFNNRQLNSQKTAESIKEK